MMKIKGKLDSVESQESQVMVLKKGIFEKNKTIKREINTLFTDLRVMIDRKEKELMANADKILEENHRGIDEVMKTVHNKKAQCRSSLDNIKTSLAKKVDVHHFFEHLLLA